MQINVRCPQCDTEYKLQAELRGKLLRCPNSVCRSVFEVRETEPRASEALSGNNGPGGARRAPFEAPPANRQAGSVGDVIPMLPAESVQEPLPEPSAPQPQAVQEPLTWRQPPPVRRSPAAGTEPVSPASAPARPKAPATPAPPPRKKTETIARPAPAPDTGKIVPKPATQIAAPSSPAVSVADSGPVEMPPGAWEPPPVRRSADTAEPEIEAASAVGTPLARRSTRIVKGALVAATSLAVVLVALLIIFWPKSEQQLFEKANQLFAEKKFGPAHEIYTQLEKDFSNSEQVATYHSLALLSDLLWASTSVNAELPSTFKQLREYCEDKDHEPLLAEHKEEVRPALLVSAAEFSERANRDSDTEMLQRANEALALAERFQPPNADKQQIAEIRQRMDQAKEHIQHAELVKKAIQKLATLVNDLDAFEREFARTVRALPELRNDRGVLQLRREAIQKLQDKVVWKSNPESNSIDPSRPVDQEHEPSLVVAPAVDEGDHVKGSTREDEIVFALVTGVLYALKQNNLEPVWWTRVGIDTTALPYRVPPTRAMKEIALVLSSDTNTLTGRVVQTGEIKWQHKLPEPCLGRPVVVAEKERAFVPTVDGKVYTIELNRGELLGFYDLGWPLTVGGVHQEIRSLRKDYLYFPADERHVFVLDIDDAARAKPCVDILESGHPSGSLRTEPILLSREGQRQMMPEMLPEDWPDLLMLYQADGLKSMKVRLFPLTSPGQPRMDAAENEQPVKGWSWFPPYHDSEKLVNVTDAGILALMGIRQLNNQDRNLFAEFNDDLFKGKPGQPGRAQVVHVADDDLWVVARGELQLWHFDRWYKKGKRMVPVWNKPLRLGSPVHASQVSEARRTAFVVTQDLLKPTSVISSVDTSIGADHPTLHWKRQLGLLCEGDPMVLGQNVLVQDEGGGLFRFDASKNSSERQVQAAIDKVADPADVVGRQQFLLPSRDGKSVLGIANVRGGQLLVRQYEPGKDFKKLSFNFAEGLAGTPGMGEDGLVVPDTKGVLWFVPLRGGQPKTGPDWRSEYADVRTAQGHVVHLGSQEFLATNGARGLVHWRWDGIVDHIKICPITPKEVSAADREAATNVVADRIIAPPLVLPKGAADEDLQVIVADSRGGLTLVREVTVMDKKRWDRAQTWQLSGRITAGPFLRGNLVGCVVDHEQLAFIDPAKPNDAPWTYKQAGEGIVGQPQLVEGLLLVAHRSGRFVGLDPATGKSLGDGYQLKANTAPATTPVAFGPGRAFAPLTDGTVMLLSLKHLRPAAAAK